MPAGNNQKPQEHRKTKNYRNARKMAFQKCCSCCLQYEK